MAWNHARPTECGWRRSFVRKGRILQQCIVIAVRSIRRTKPIVAIIEGRTGCKAWQIRNTLKRDAIYSVICCAFVIRRPGTEIKPDVLTSEVPEIVTGSCHVTLGSAFTAGLIPAATVAKETPVLSAYCIREPGADTNRPRNAVFRAMALGYKMSRCDDVVMFSRV